MTASATDEKLKALRQKALALGFDGFGVTAPQMPDAVRNYQRWIELGYEGEMAYMARWREKRSDMNLVLEGVKSVVCLRTDYLTAHKDMGFLEERDVGDISLYALNEDYHDVIGPRLKQLERFIREQWAGCQTKVYVDTGPVLEKPLAQQAGLGWIGKHTNLLSEGIGSWYFLSEILVDVALTASDPAPDRCGTCQECIDICPTGAIVAPYVLDSRKCLSYLNIEYKGVIPLEYRKAMGNRIYGCDDCQIVCPWNEHAAPVPEAAFAEPVTTRRLIDLIGMDDAAFRERFRKSPIKRIKRRGFLRNVAVALGNSGNPDAVEPLVRVLDDAEPLIRAHAVWALGELLGDAAAARVRTPLQIETDPWVLAEIRRLDPGFAPVSGSQAAEGQ